MHMHPSSIINPLCTGSLASGHSERPLSYLRSLSRPGLANFKPQENNIICKHLPSGCTCAYIHPKVGRVGGIYLSNMSLLQTKFVFIT
jgi:hypothetical protein